MQNLNFMVILDNLQQAINALAYTLQEEMFDWNLNLAISLMVNSLNLNSAYYYIFRNLSMIAYMIEIQ